MAAPSSTNPLPGPALACPNCRAGALRLARVVFAAWRGGLFATIPNFPAWLCDACGWHEYDAAALEKIALVLGPAPAGQSPEAAGRLAPGQPGVATPSRASGRRLS